MTQHATHNNGALRATPNCPCDYCRGVFDDWAEQAIGFQRLMNGLSGHRLQSYFGEQE